MKKYLNIASNTMAAKSTVQKCWQPEVELERFLWRWHTMWKLLWTPLGGQFLCPTSYSLKHHPQSEFILPRLSSKIVLCFSRIGSATNYVVFCWDRSIITSVGGSHYAGLFFSSPMVLSILYFFICVLRRSISSTTFLYRPRLPFLVKSRRPWYSDSSLSLVNTFRTKISSC